MPHFAHIVLATVMPGVLVASHLASHRWDDDAVQTVDDIDPDEPTNISCLVAFELTQAKPQSC